MKYRISMTIVTCLLLMNMVAIAQDNKKQPVKFTDRLFTGGSIGLQFGTQTMIEASPIIGYKITENLAAGIGVTYQYYRLNYYGNILKTSIYGGSIFTRYYFLQNFFLHCEYEALNMETAFFDPKYFYHKQDRYWAGSVLAGGGYRQFIGETSSFNIMILYNFNDTPYSPYASPLIFRVGIDIGL